MMNKKIEMKSIDNLIINLISKFFLSFPFFANKDEQMTNGME